MQDSNEPHHGDVFEDSPHADDQKIDSVALRILAAWIARRSGIEQDLGSTIDHSFVVAHAHS
jgi:hypothetical protein